VTYSCTGNLYFAGGLALVVGVTNIAAFCQTQEPAARPKFEVASIRLHANADNKSYVQALQGKLVITNFSLKQLIVFAYDFPSNQVSGSQAWMDSDRYDIQAKAVANSSVKEEEGPMLQALLEERFNLKVHRDTAERPVYELTVEKGGVKMQRSKEGSCTPYSVDSQPPLPVAGAPRPVFCDFPRFGAGGQNRTLDGSGVSMGKLAGSLSRFGLDRPVIDETGLAGGFDLHLKWAIEVPVSATELSTTDEPVGFSIITALKEQLGLKLESAKGPVEILVVDHVERPSEN
jgi:uncharacterized protein (TIGR03435 family)